MTHNCSGMSGDPDKSSDGESSDTSLRQRGGKLTRGRLRAKREVLDTVVKSRHDPKGGKKKTVVFWGGTNFVLPVKFQSAYGFSASDLYRLRLSDLI